MVALHPEAVPGHATAVTESTRFAGPALALRALAGDTAPSASRRLPMAGRILPAIGGPAEKNTERTSRTEAIAKADPSAAGAGDEALFRRAALDSAAVLRADMYRALPPVTTRFAPIRASDRRPGREANSDPNRWGHLGERVEFHDRVLSVLNASPAPWMLATASGEWDAVMKVSDRCIPMRTWFEMAALRPRGCYRLPLVAPSEVLESARGPIANSVQGRARRFTKCPRLGILGTQLRQQGSRTCTGSGSTYE